ncbi:MAG TPA: hypothetical protein VI072_18485 [Polyangiaceae bacterium]
MIENVEFSGAAVPDLNGGFDYHLTAGSACINAGTNPGNSSRGFSLIPTFEYVHPTSSVARSSSGSLDIGAHEFGTVTGSCAWRSGAGTGSVSSLLVGLALLALRCRRGRTTGEQNEALEGRASPLRKT